MPASPGEESVAAPEAIEPQKAAAAAPAAKRASAAPAEQEVEELEDRRREFKKAARPGQP